MLKNVGFCTLVHIGRISFVYLELDLAKAMSAADTGVDLQQHLGGKTETTSRSKSLRGQEAKGARADFGCLHWILEGP